MAWPRPEWWSTARHCRTSPFTSRPRSRPSSAGSRPRCSLEISLSPLPGLFLRHRFLRYCPGAGKRQSGHPCALLSNAMSDLSEVERDILDAVEKASDEAALES